MHHKIRVCIYMSLEWEINILYVADPDNWTYTLCIYAEKDKWLLIIITNTGITQ